jgi:hypothetical protein
MRTDSPDHSARVLAGVLAAQAELFDELAELVDAQRRALVAGASEELERLSGRAESLSVRFRMLEQERERLDAAVPADHPDLGDARQRARGALGRLLREAAISGAVLERFGDTVAARQAAFGVAFAASYLPDGRVSPPAERGGRLSAEG